MDKIASFGGYGILGTRRAFLKRRPKLLKLALWQSVKEGLEENNGFPQAGIQIVMRRIKDIPLAVGVQGIACEDLLRGSVKIGGKLLDEFCEGGDFVEEL